VGNNLGPRPATRDDTLPDAAVDAVVDGLRERVHEPGGRHRDHAHRAGLDRAALVASYWKTLFLYEAGKGE
jgi:diacylglycerol kinase